MMRTLILVRHGNAEPGDAGVPDFERALIKPGKQACREVAKRLRKQKIKAKRWITSPAIRALQSARQFAKQMNFPRKSIQLAATIYNENSADGLMEFLKQIDDKVPSVMLFGHDPGFTELAKQLIQGFNASIPTSGAVVLEWDGSWADLKPRCAQLVCMAMPMDKESRSRYRKYWSDVSESMQQQMTIVVKKADPTIQSTVENAIPKICDILIEQRLKQSTKYILRSQKEIAAVLQEKSVESMKTEVKPETKSARVANKSNAKLVTKPVSTVKKSGTEPVASEKKAPKKTKAARSTPSVSTVVEKPVSKTRVARKGTTSKIKTNPTARPATPVQPEKSEQVNLPPDSIE
ncbi:histidine phosphatase family protein [candidate division KSB1 bacterium]|nr:histidine phosphatase family protein [candidate division KSB1 bacterium]